MLARGRWPQDCASFPGLIHHTFRTCYPMFFLMRKVSSQTWDLVLKSWSNKIKDGSLMWLGKIAAEWGTPVWGWEAKSYACVTLCHHVGWFSCHWGWFTHCPLECVSSTLYALSLEFSFPFLITHILKKNHSRPRPSPSTLEQLSSPPASHKESPFLCCWDCFVVYTRLVCLS